MSVSRFVSAIAIACLTIGVAGSVYFSLIDQYVRARDWDRALRLAPSHRKALVNRGAPADLERAAAKPTGSAALIELALEAELKGDNTTAQRMLDEANRRDAGYRPRWARANFYFRQGRHRELAAVAGPAARIYEGDLTALYDLVLRAGLPPPQIYREIVPPRAQAQREYLELLIVRGRGPDGIAAALRLADQARPKDRDLLLGYCDQLLAQGEGPKAGQLWKALPRFALSAGRCLDWKRSTVDGVSLFEVADQVARFELNGNQPSDAVLLRRYAIVEPGRRYHLRAITNAEEALQKTVEWRWNGAAVGTGRESDIEIEARQTIGELQLAVKRPAGQRSAEGAVEITNIRLEPKAAALARLR
ncbi:MAG: hypothetical protein IT162_04690 [Bryobacterales bacterium]|nr:hypothetical protein [Bryobacterales bacterium]